MRGVMIAVLCISALAGTVRAEGPLSQKGVVALAAIAETYYSTMPIEKRTAAMTLLIMDTYRMDPLSATTFADTARKCADERQSNSIVPIEHYLLFCVSVVPRLEKQR